MTPVILQDRIPLRLLKERHPSLLEFISRAHPQSVAGNDRLHFCGVACPDFDQSFVFLPRGSAVDFDERDGRLTMMALARYGRDVESRVGNSATNGGDTNLAATIQAIVADYQRSGLYVQRLRIRARNSGKPDWKRTLQRRTPLVSRQRSPVYSEIECSKFLNASDNLLAKIQAATLGDILAKHGWWTGLENSVVSELANVKKPDHAAVHYPAALRRFKRTLFDDRSLALVSLLEHYWDAQASHQEGQFICGVPDFSAVWEQMLKATVDDVSAKWNARLPVPGYRYENDDFVPRSQSGIMDIVVETNADLVVADAKYYQAETTNTAPGFGDILKQSFYARGLKGLGHTQTVHSVFVFPTWGESAKLVEGSFYDRELADQIDWLEPVDCLYVNLRSLMASYTRRAAKNWIAAYQN